MLIPVPLINSFTYCPEFSKAFIAPIIRSLFIICEEESFISAYGSKIINAISICISKRESRLLYQLRKNPTVVLSSRHKKANGEERIRIFIKIYLIAKLIINEKDEMESIPVRIPSKENMLNSDEKEELSIFISEEKEISLLNIFVPREKIKVVISYVKEIASVQSEREKFIKIVKKIPFIIKIYGDSTSLPE